ncbi:Alpha-N-acetylgalactosamine-specific lectin [Thelohanellus kitauei]|uniref:Alpha-N-acetylgalactosamine-specific lectin n=1 Tax=Thelohanellus kitauei TaxID=669202 RepID=A0A0C2MFY0_THEKT|nr:Alpha-N-acetylgalactosamine-specific lectin [Thelohanellus kitauei]
MLIFFIYLVLSALLEVSNLDEYDDEHYEDRYEEPTRYSLDSAAPASQDSSLANETEDIFPMYYVPDPDTPEITAHSNRILACSDHVLARNVCAKANFTSLCFENEVYAYSFCRQSCGFCEEINSLKHSVWRLLPGTTFKPTWPILELDFFSKYPIEVDPLNITSPFASSSYEGYSASNAFDDNNETYWMPSIWGIHEPKSEWIGAVFEQPVIINAISVRLKEIEGSVFPTVLHVESANSMSEAFVNRWSVRISSHDNGEIILKPGCPPLWKLIDVNETYMCVKFFGQYMTWEQAETSCKKYNAHLISFEGQEHLSVFLDKFVVRGPSWIGLNDKEREGVFVWSDGSNNTYSIWESGDQKDELRLHEENCVLLTHEGRFTTSDCHDKHFYSCQKPYEKFMKPKPDPKEPDTKPPIVFDIHDLYNPIAINEKNENISFNVTLEWPIEFKIPITMDNRTTYKNKPSLFSVSPHHNDTKNARKTVNVPEGDKVEQPFHRVIEKKKRRHLRKHGAKNHIVS